MKPLLKILKSLNDRIIGLPEGSKIPKWIKITIKCIKLINNIILFFRQLKSYVSMFLLWFKNLYFVYCTDKSEARVFTGWGYRDLAVKYADKRSEISRVNKVCGGKRHFVLTYDNDSLIVLNRIEMINLKKKRFLKKDYNIVNTLENAFYVTP